MMNLLQQFQAVFRSEKRSVARLVVQNPDSSWEARTSSGNQPIRLTGQGYTVGQMVFYDIITHKILEIAPDVVVVELVV